MSSLKNRIKRARKLVRSQFRRGLTPVKVLGEQVEDEGELHPGVMFAVQCGNPVPADPGDSQSFAFAMVELGIRIREGR